MNWFGPKHPQQTTLKNFTVLVGKAPTKSKRIRSNWTIDLTGGDNPGAPPWLLDARNFVMKTRQTVQEQHQASGVNVAFGDPNLFEKMTVEAPKSDLRKFVVFSGGSSDEPTTILSFTMYSPFSTDLCRWLGQMAGEAFTSTYESSIPEEDESESGNLELSSDDEDEDSDEEYDDEEEEDEEEDNPLTSTASSGPAYETARRKAIAPENDKVFAVPPPKPATPKAKREADPNNPADIAAARDNLLNKM
jgi:hypothetical protein